MMAFEIVGHNYRATVVGEGTKSSPLFNRFQFEEGLGSDTSFDANGQLVFFSSANPQGAAAPDDYLVNRIPLPEWAKKKDDSTQSTQEDDMAGFSKDKQVGKEKKDVPAKPAAKAKPKSEAKPAAEKPKSADELRLAEVCKTIAKHAGEITTLRAEKVALKKKLGQ